MSRVTSSRPNPGAKTKRGSIPPSGSMIGGPNRKSKAKDQSALPLRIREIAYARPRFGYQRIHGMLRREDWPVNKKRVRRLYRLEGLQLRMRIRRRKHMCLHRGPVPQPTVPWELEHGFRA